MENEIAMVLFVKHMDLRISCRQQLCATPIGIDSQGIVATVLPSSEWSEERNSANNIGIKHGRGKLLRC